MGIFGCYFIYICPLLFSLFESPVCTVLAHKTYRGLGLFFDFFFFLGLDCF